MRTAGVNVFTRYTGDLEGIVPYCYLDILGLVTVAIGNLVDPMSAALSLPMVHADGSPADRAEIAAEWQTLKAMWCGTKVGAAKCPWRGVKTCLAHLGHLAAKRVAKLYLTPEGVAGVVGAKLAQNNAALVKRCPDFEDWPVDAQLGLHSWAWAVGSAAVFPRFIAALNDRDFDEAVKHCHINEDGPDRIPGTADDNWGLKPRNVANKIMFANAAKVQNFKLDPDELLYDVTHAPHVGPTNVPPVDHVAPRQSWVNPNSEEALGSGGIIHPPIYDEDWVRPLGDE